MRRRSQRRLDRLAMYCDPRGGRRRAALSHAELGGDHDLVAAALEHLAQQRPRSPPPDRRRCPRCPGSSRPASSAASTTARVPSRSTRRPKLLQPSPTSDTSSSPIFLTRASSHSSISRRAMAAGGGTWKSVCPATMARSSARANQRTSSSSSSAARALAARVARVEADHQRRRERPRLRRAVAQVGRPPRRPPRSPRARPPPRATRRARRTRPARCSGPRGQRAWRPSSTRSSARVVDEHDHDRVGARVVGRAAVRAGAARGRPRPSPCARRSGRSSGWLRCQVTIAVA